MLNVHVFPPRLFAATDVEHPPTGPMLRRFAIDPHSLPLDSKMTVMDERLIAFITARHHFVKKLLISLSLERTLTLNKDAGCDQSVESVKIIRVGALLPERHRLRGSSK